MRTLDGAGILLVDKRNEATPSLLCVPWQAWASLGKPWQALTSPAKESTETWIKRQVVSLTFWN